jgi:hypothetical protein
MEQLENEIHFKDITSKKKEAPHPYLLHFPNAPPPPETLKNYGKEPLAGEDVLQLSVFTQNDSRRMNQRYILGETERLQYTSDNLLSSHNINSFDF